ncbi:MAG: hypothetical protein D6799_02490 [Bacteroidetes bacterium]|nr:MAG: hypothetical protein D6799_02490 [Bacteroidota bacterium]
MNNDNIPYLLEFKKTNYGLLLIVRNAITTQELAKLKLKGNELLPLNANILNAIQSIKNQRLHTYQKYNSSPQCLSSDEYTSFFNKTLQKNLQPIKDDENSDEYSDEPLDESAHSTNYDNHDDNDDDNDEFLYPNDLPF